MDGWLDESIEGMDDFQTAAPDVHCQGAFIGHLSYRLPWQLASLHFVALIRDRQEVTPGS